MDTTRAADCHRRLRFPESVLLGKLSVAMFEQRRLLNNSELGPSGQKTGSNRQMM